MTERIIQNESVTVYSVYDGVYFELTADIDLGNKERTPIGRYGARFNGKFNGNGHVIKNVSITKLYVGVGLFGVTGPSVLIENLGIDGFTGNVPSANYGVNKMDEFIKFGNPAGNTTTYLWGSGSMVGIYSGGTFKNSYVRNADYTTSASTGEAGFGGFAGNDVVTSFCPNVYFTNCYVVNVKAKVKDQASGFIARMGEIGNSGDALGYYENCYVGGTIDLESTSGDSYEYGFGYRASREPQKLSNCFTTTLLSTNKSILSAESTKADIVAGLANVDGWYADHATAPINGSYPILDWQNTWKKPYEVKAVTIADGNVTDVTLKQNEAITGVVIVAVYAGDRFLGAVTADAAAGLVDITDIAAAAGNTVKVFVWDSLSALSPVAYEYATTVE